MIKVSLNSSGINSFCLPHVLKQLMELFSQSCTPFLVDLSQNWVWARRSCTLSTSLIWYQLEPVARQGQDCCKWNQMHWMTMTSYMSHYALHTWLYVAGPTFLQIVSAGGFLCTVHWVHSSHGLGKQALIHQELRPNGCPYLIKPATWGSVLGFCQWCMLQLLKAKGTGGCKARAKDGWTTTERARPEVLLLHEHPVHPACTVSIY